MDCIKFQENISAYLDGELRGEELRDFLLHKEQCSDCRRELRECRMVSEAFAAMPRKVCPDELSARIHAAIRAEQEKPAGRQLPWRKYVGIAAALVLLVGGGFIGMMTSGAFNMGSQENMQDHVYTADKLQTESKPELYTKSTSTAVINSIGYTGPDDEDNETAEVRDTANEIVVLPGAPAAPTEDTLTEPDKVGESIDWSLLETGMSNVGLKYEGDILPALEELALAFELPFRHNADKGIFAILLAPDRIEAVKAELGKIGEVLSYPDAEALNAADGMLLIKLK